jgi:hypothetical protein
MIKDIHVPKVEDIAIAVVKEGEVDELHWNVYLVNLKEEQIDGVLVSSKGYGTIKGKDVKTSVLRHFFDTMAPRSFVMVEPIMENVFPLNNEYWVSFYIKGVIYDKKFVFLPETIQENFFSTIPVLNKRGVMIR